MNKDRKINVLAISILVVVFIFFLIILFVSEGFYGGGDNLTHYRFSRYAYIYPEFLVHHWAKPLFTLISFPFAQFGFAGVQIMNVLFGVASSFLCYMIARKLRYNYSPVVIIFLCFTPIYTIIMYSGMTEIMFGFICILSSYLFISKRYKTSSAVIGFSPFVRTEGIFMVPVFGLALLLKKKYIAIPFLVLAFVLYSIIGFFHYHDIFWLITKMPYRGATELYGTGHLDHYFASAKTYLGLPVAFLLITGIIHVFISFFRKKNRSYDELVVVITPFLIYFTAHVLMWYTGIGNSDGETRYMAAIIPYVALLNLKGINGILDIIHQFIRNRFIDYVIILFVAVVIMYMPFKSYRIPTTLQGSQKVIRQSAEWMKSEELAQRKVYYYDPDYIYFLDFNPFDEKQAHEFVYDPKAPHKGIEIGALVLWEAHYTPNCRLKKETMVGSPYFRLLKTFKPDHSFQVFGRDYEVCIFERILYEEDNTKPD